MPKVTSTPKALKPFLFHGLDVSVVGDEPPDAQLPATCPWCSREGKFYICAGDGLWQCKICMTGTDKGGGNVYTFLRTLWKLSDEATKDYDDLAQHRRLLFPETLMHWGVCRSIIDGSWLVPGYGADGNLNQLYKYVETYDAKERKKVWRLYPTPELGHQIHRPAEWNKDRPGLYLCEGPWDGMALWEMLKNVKRREDGTLGQTGSELSSLLSIASVLAVPGCGSVGEPFKKWTPLFTGKDLAMLFDSDHPKRQCRVCSRAWSTVEHDVCPQCGGELEDRVLPPAGSEALKRGVQILAASAERPDQVSYLNWGEGGYDPERADGCDVRDLLASGDTVLERIPALEAMLARIEKIPDGWVPGGFTKAKARKSHKLDIESVPCNRWEVLRDSWRWMRWTAGLNKAFIASLACCASTKASGEQLWIKMIGPASCGKTTLCEGLSVNRKWVYPKDTLTGLSSGYQLDREGSENLSLAPRLKNKTLVINDGDTLLKLPNLGQVLSQLRAFYGRNLRSQYKNKMSEDFEGVNCTIILCGTSALRQIDHSEVGERFLDVVIMEDIDDELEDEILWRVANRADRAMNFEVDGMPETQYDPDQIYAMQLTGGYLDYLRTNASSLLPKIHMSPQVLKRCTRLGKFVAFMRARPSQKQIEAAEREFASRLTAQIVRMAKCTALVLNRSEIDQEVMALTTAIAMDTARGRVLDIVRVLSNEELEEGAFLTQLAARVNETEDKARTLLKFMKKIGAVETYTTMITGRDGEKIKSRPKWRMTEKMQDLFEEIVETF